MCIYIYRMYILYNIYIYIFRSDRKWRFLLGWTCQCCTTWGTSDLDLSTQHFVWPSVEFDNSVECRYVWQLQVISQKAATILGSHYDVSTRICDVSFLKGLSLFHSTAEKFDPTSNQINLLSHLMSSFPANRLGD